MRRYLDRKPRPPMADLGRNPNSPPGVSFGPIYRLTDEQGEVILGADVLESNDSRTLQVTCYLPANTGAGDSAVVEYVVEIR